MPRRRLTVRRIDPWSVLKFGAVANVVLLLIGLLVVGVVFYIIDRIGLIEQVCDVILEVGFEACGIDAGNLFRAIALLGLLGVVIQTAVLVFLSFLHNLIADLTGGLAFTVIDDTPVAPRPAAAAPVTAGTPPSTTARPAQAAGGGPRGGTSSPPVPPIGRDQDTVRHEPVRGTDTGDRSDEGGSDLFRR